MTLRPGFPERGGFADRFAEIDRRLAALERSKTTIWTFAETVQDGTTAALGTSPAVRASQSIDVPSWVRRLTVAVVANILVATPGGETGSVLAQLDIAGETSQQWVGAFYDVQGTTGAAADLNPHFSAEFEDTDVPDPLEVDFLVWRNSVDGTGLGLSWGLTVFAIGLPV